MRAMPYGPRCRPAGRAALRLVGIAASIAIAGCGADARPHHEPSEDDTCTESYITNFGSWRGKPYREISVAEYNNLQIQFQCEPALRPIIAKAIADGRVTQSEMDEIESAETDALIAAHERERRRAAEALRRQTLAKER